MTIEFDQAAHQYRVDGLEVPSVTTLVAPLGEDYDDPDSLAELDIDNAAERGTVMHAYLAHRLNGGAGDDFELPAAYSPYADSAELFLAEHEIYPVLIENPLACGEFAGTPDLVCEFDGADAILDWKFVSAISKSKVGAQLAGYHTLCAENGIYPDRLLAVQFLPDGTYRIYPVEQGAANEAFSICLKLYRIACKKHPRGQIF